MGVKVKKLGVKKDSETDDVKKAQAGDKDALVRQQKRQKVGGSDTKYAPRGPGIDLKKK